MTKKIGILGGTFDPPHIGHLIIANECLERAKLDEVWFMPNNVPPHKQMQSNVSNKERLELIERSIGDHPSFKIEDIELMREGKSFTIDTMRLLLERHPGWEFYFIIGGDMIESLSTWHKIEELVKLVQFIGVKRPEYEISTSIPVSMIDIPEIHLSSTVIRERLKKGKSIRYLVPKEVEDYIKEFRLYGKN